MNKADNLPMSVDEWYYNQLSKQNGKILSIFEIAEEYANYLLSHHINALTERKYSEEEVEFLISLLRTTTEYEVLESFRNRVEQFKK